MGAFSDEMAKAVDAANEYVAREIEDAVESGQAVHFMEGGRFYERTREGVFEVEQVGEQWVRRKQLARRVEPPTPQVEHTLAVGS